MVHVKRPRKQGSLKFLLKGQSFIISVNVSLCNKSRTTFLVVQETVSGRGTAADPHKDLTFLQRN